MSTRFQSAHVVPKAEVPVFPIFDSFPCVSISPLKQKATRASIPCSPCAITKSCVHPGFLRQPSSLKGLPSTPVVFDQPGVFFVKPHWISCFFVKPHWISFFCNITTRPRLARKHNIASEVGPTLQDAFFFLHEAFVKRARDSARRLMACWLIE